MDGPLSRVELGPVLNDRRTGRAGVTPVTRLDSGKRAICLRSLEPPTLVPRPCGPSALTHWVVQPPSPSEPPVITSQGTPRVPTYTPKASEITRDWVIIDADGLVLGRLATEVARILRGKHKPTFAPHMDMGDHVIIINADKVVLTSGKAEKKKIYRHSGYPGGIKEQTFADLLDRKPEEAVRRSVRGMLPHNRLGRAQLRKLKVYAGPSHPHAAQQPKVLELDHARRSA
jgi:large subunit ribosomal protein L13